MQRRVVDLTVAGILVLLVAIFLNGSLAVLLLGLPVVMISYNEVADKRNQIAMISEQAES